MTTAPTASDCNQPVNAVGIRSTVGLDVRQSSQTSLFKDGRLLVWFSCGAASACALKLVAHMNPLAIYCDLSKNENADNLRFRADVERWTGIKVTVIKSKLYDTVEEVFEARQYMSGPAGDGAQPVGDDDGLSARGGDEREESVGVCELNKIL